MAQADLNVANQSGAAFRSDLNGQLLALGTLQSGASAPSTTYAYMQWADTTTGLLKIRDASNAAWITVGTLASTNLGLATLASPTFTGTPAAPTATAGTNTTQIATTAFVAASFLTTSSASSTYAPLASPALTGTPTAPTATAGTNTTQVASTAYVVSQATAKAGDTMTGDLTVPSLNSDSLAGTRSRIMNGAMVIDQRNTGSSISSGIGAVTYTVDRWYVFATTAAVTAQRVTSSNTAFTNALRVTGAASNAGVSIGQRIEVQNSYDMAGKTVTLSFYAATSASLTLTWKAYYAGAANDFTSKTQSNTGTQATTSTLTKYSATFTLSSSATTGVAIEFTLASLTSGSIDITGVQLELGSAATPFERRSFGQELALCQRYYLRDTATAPAQTSFLVGLINTATTSTRCQRAFPVPMRAVPTISYNSLRLYDGGVVSAVTSIAVNCSSTTLASVDFVASAGGLTATRSVLVIENSSTSYVDYSAEL